MDELGLFPLGMVLLPTERAPLHVFEERYKELVGECLERDGEFGLVLADDEGIREIGTRAAVVAVLARFDDGRLNVVVEGRERFRIVALTSGRSFRTAEVEPLDDVDAEPDAAAVADAVANLRRVAELAGSDAEDLDPLTASPSFELAAKIELEPRLKQGLLESRSEPERLKRLVRLLDGAAEALAARAERARLAATNGHVRLRP
ncbi:MAG TPA: LON peptidase substrate-binding domain-containing protein [Gaiellaceae bacterium]|nr:LON peptidase substrate-binding domain-containing protein [Gaiellaceae bacterium]